VSNVDFATDDWLYASVFAGGIKIHYPVEGAVVGYGQGVHAQFLGLGDQVWYAADAVQHAVLGMSVQVSELGLWTWFGHPTSAVVQTYS
jgi:hypothetical protein